MAFDTSIISQGLLYTLTIVLVAIFFLTRKVVIPEIKRRLRSGQGMGWVRIIGPDKHEQEDFVNLRNDFVKVGKRVFFPVLETCTYKGTDTEIPMLVLKDKDAVSTDQELRNVRQQIAEISGLLKDKKRMKALSEEQEKALMQNLETLENIKAEREKFLKSQVESFNYVLDRTATTMKGKYPVYTFRYDKCEPVDYFALDMSKGHDPGRVDLQIQKALTMGNLQSAIGGKKMSWVIIVAGILLAAAAYFSYETNGMVKDLMAAKGLSPIVFSGFLWRKLFGGKEK